MEKELIFIVNEEHIKNNNFLHFILIIYNLLLKYNPNKFIICVDVEKKRYGRYYFPCYYKGDNIQFLELFSLWGKGYVDNKDCKNYKSYLSSLHEFKFLIEYNSNSLLTNSIKFLSYSIKSLILEPISKNELKKEENEESYLKSVEISVKKNVDNVDNVNNVPNDFLHTVNVEKIVIKDEIQKEIVKNGEKYRYVDETYNLLPWNWRELCISHNMIHYVSEKNDWKNKTTQFSTLPQIEVKEKRVVQKNEKIWLSDLQNLNLKGWLEIKN